jgi:hypothetical protein
MFLSFLPLLQLKIKQMATSRQVKCINKGDRYNPHTRITHIGGDGWKETQLSAIGQIQTGTYAYWVSVGGLVANVIVAFHNTNRYLKTDKDSSTVDNLLSLKEC